MCITMVELGHLAPGGGVGRRVARHVHRHHFIYQSGAVLLVGLSKPLLKYSMMALVDRRAWLDIIIVDVMDQSYMSGFIVAFCSRLDCPRTTAIREPPMKESRPGDPTRPPHARQALTVMLRLVTMLRHRRGCTPLSSRLLSPLGPLEGRVKRAYCRGQQMYWRR